MLKKHFIKTAALAALATAAGVGSAFAQSTPAIQPMSGAPEIRDGEQRFKVRGRFQFDVTSSEWDALDEDASRSYVRRAFLGAQGRLTDRWRYKIDFVLNPGAGVDDAATGDGSIAVDDAYLEYAGDFFSIVNLVLTVNLP